jgi:hypothetical protein
MTKFKRRSVEVEAVPFTADSLALADEGSPICKIAEVCRAGNFWSLRSDPSVALKFGDWVVHTADGAVIVLSDGEFHAKYEAVSKK